MSDPTLTRQYGPIEEETSGASAVLRFLFAAALLVDAALIAFPDLIRFVAPGWSGDPNQVRLAAFGGLVAYLVFSGVRSQRRRSMARRAAFSQFAAAVGSHVTEVPYRPTASGWEGGTRVAYRAAGWPAVLDTERRSESTSMDRVAADVVLRRDFQLLIVPGGKATRFLLSGKVLGPVFALAVRTSSSRGGAASGTPGAPGTGPTPEQLFERIRYVSGDPIVTGDESFDRNFIVKASDAALGRTLVADGSVRAALLALRGRSSGFQISLESGEGAGPARLVVGTTAGDATGETFGAMDALLRAALSGLHRLDLLEPGARGAA